ncbi:Membrane protein involved in the export of O-antigen and teichoic acid [Micromonospora peucetia]|uniref:Membrane protein involved in the export of O-antigen and teichoic acid n=2 Tax=Micromonospora peucetia TaxID=47871 RepID=A0A1C6W702_9ACTN|nr:Membrane protein involved in the export of O-antigen and teichoic acid [Micromonospora peucetia]
MSLSREVATSVRAEPPLTTADTDVLPARDRQRRLLTGMAATVLCRAVGVVTPLVLIPVMLAELGPNLYGLWAAVGALTAMAAFADLGLGNGLMTRLAPCFATGDTARARRYVSSAYVLLTGIAVLILLCLWSASPLVPWSGLIGADGPAGAEAEPFMLACLTAFVVNVPLSLVVRVQFAYQQVAQSNLWQALGGLSAVPLVLLAVHVDMPPVGVVTASVTGPVLTNLLTSCWVYGRALPQLRPRLRAADRGEARELVALGGLFFLLTIVMSVANNADSLLIAHVLQMRDVTDFAVAARLFAQVGILVSLVNVPLWTANGDALARGEIDWVRRTSRRMTIVSSSMAVVLGGGLVFAGGPLLGAWAGIRLEGGGLLLAGLACWWVLLAAMSPCFMVQNAAGVIRPQLLGWTAYLAVSIPLKWYAAGRYGVAAVPITGALVYLLTVVPGALHGYRAVLNDPAATAKETD